VALKGFRPGGVAPQPPASSSSSASGPSSSTTSSSDASKKDGEEEKEREMEEEEERERERERRRTAYEKEHSQPELLLSVREYVSSLVDSDRIWDGVDAYIDNRELLEAIYKKYGVDPEVRRREGGGKTGGVESGLWRWHFLTSLP
jgi:membrane-bound lytic murein transglycosylase B